MHLPNKFGLIGAAVAAALYGLPAAAQSPAQPVASEEMEEVLVTARMRSESRQDVPITVNVFTAENIEAAGIQKPADFISRVPNMTLVETQNAGNAFVVLRGISQARNSEPSVAVLVDGVLETNPAEFNQELFDIEQIEVLKGPQGAVYGRNAIGGAIIIRTKDPGDEFEGRVKLGAGNGSSINAQGEVSGPIGDTFGYRASVNYYDTDGYLPSTFLGGKADPVQSLAGRLRLTFKPSDTFSGDVRLSYENLDTRGFYFVIPRDDEANPFSTFTTPPNANDVSSPIQVDQTGVDNRDLFTGAVKLDFKLGGGTLSSISSYNSTEEIITGDAYDFRPAANSIFNVLLGFDLNQSQFLDLSSWSQEVRFTSSDEGRLRWILGGYFVHTDRFISTGNMVDDGTGVYPVYHHPRLTGNNPSATFLADSQDNDAWAVFGDATFEISDQFELDVALRYDEDRRENTTETPTAFLPDPSASTGEVRTETFSETQPKVTLRYKPSDDITLYGGWSRGFRSGGFNQTGVGAVAAANGIVGVSDVFQAETADTLEAGFKTRLFDDMLSFNGAVFTTKSENSYFFVFLAANSTQNLGNVPRTRINGFELEAVARPARYLQLNAAWGMTFSNIKEFPDPAVIGNEAPLISRSTLNIGAQFAPMITDSLDGLFRIDYRRTGRTWWEPYNTTVRDPVDLVDARAGVEGENWGLFVYAKNLFNEEYNAEFSPGGFVFKARPRVYGVEANFEF